MKISLFFLFFGILVLQAANSFSQEIFLSFDLKSAPIKDICKEIEKRSNYRFVFSRDARKIIDKKRDLSVEAEKIDRILDIVLSNTTLTYHIIDTQIAVYEDTAKKTDTEKTELVLEKEPQQEKRTITGKVTDEKGEPVIGANIVEKNSKNGAVTDNDGFFSLQVETKDAVIQISYIGYLTQNVDTKGEMILNIKLKEDTQALDEVVVTGVFTRRVNNYTGSIKTIKFEEMERVGNSNILQVLKDIDPSFQVLENNQLGSDPNRIPDIQMRGASSFYDMKNKYQTNPNQPLFVVDGFDQSINKVMDMDMNRIASITLLKDATAKTLYGSKGANGVIVIETRKPESGKIKINYAGSLNMQIPDLSSYRLCNARDKLEVERLAGVYTSSTNNPLQQQLLDEEYYRLRKEVERGVNTYWLNKPLRVGVGNKHALTFEGGDEFIRYSLDANYSNLKGVMKRSGRETVGGGFMFSYRYKNLLFREHLSLLHSKADNSPYGSFADYAKLNSYWRAYNEDGTIKEIIGTYNVANNQGYHPIYNPLINANLSTNDNNKYTDITNNFYIEWLIVKDLKATARMGFTYRADESDTFYPRDHTMFKRENMTDEEYFKRGQYTKQNGKASNMTVDAGLNYSNVFGKHVFFGNMLWNIGEYKTESVSFQAEGFANNKLDYITHAQKYKEGEKPFGYESLVRDIGVLLSTNYSFDTRYLLDANYRANASSLFGANKRWGHFWSVGVGWNLHYESFFKNLMWLQQLKLRASTGYTGSQNFNSYQAISTYKYFGNEVYDNIIGSYLVGLPNPDLQWQKTQDNNIGFNISFLNRLDLTFDYYVKNTSDLLTPVTLPPSVGFISYTENLGKSQNKGFEAQVNIRVIRMPKQNFYLNLFASLNHNTNVIKEINDALTSINDRKDEEKKSNYDHEKEKILTTKPSVRYVEGTSMSAIWAVRSLGIDPGTGNELFLTKEGLATYQWNAKDQVVCGDELPKYVGTFGFNMEWNGFSVNTSFYYKMGGQMYNQTLVDKVEDADIQYNVDQRVYSGRWMIPGQNAQFKRLATPNYFTRPTSRFVQNRNELQMSSLNIGYDFREKDLLRQWKIERLKLNFYMNDVFRISGIKTERGTDYPFSQTFSFQLQATF